MKKPEPDKAYIKRVNELSPSTPSVKNCIFAFIAGGTVCFAGEILFNFYIYFIKDEAQSRTLVSVTLIIITAILTGIGVYDRLAEIFGAGVGVPISGFANSVCSPAIEYAIEGHILGTAEKMFSLAGAVIVYGCSMASFYGIIYYFFIKGGI